MSIVQIEDLNTLTLRYSYSLPCLIYELQRRNTKRDLEGTKRVEFV